MKKMNSLATTFVFANLIGKAAAAWRMPLGSSYLRRASVVQDATKRVLPAYPFGRFTEWKDVDKETQELAKLFLEYNEETWNYPGQNEFELLSYETIFNLTNGTALEIPDAVVQKQEDPWTPIRVISEHLNFTEDSWDCWINHYLDYDWEELMEYQVESYFEALGWNEKNWMGEEEAPKSEDKEWFELTEAEERGARALCYFPEVWAEDIEISFWTYKPEKPDAILGEDDKNVTGTNSQAGEYVVRRPVSFSDLPATRFVVWDNLTPIQQSNAITIGFNDTTWNNPGSVELVLNYTFYGALTAEQVMAAIALGIDDFYWDCLIQHYNQYPWNELASKGVKAFYETLDWSFYSWHGLLPPPATANMTFEELTPEQQTAAEELCYLPETYAGLGLSEIKSFPPP